MKLGGPVLGLIRAYGLFMASVALFVAVAFGAVVGDPVGSPSIGSLWLYRLSILDRFSAATSANIATKSGLSKVSLVSRSVAFSAP